MFKAVGLGLADVAIAAEVLRRAAARGSGGPLRRRAAFHAAMEGHDHEPAEVQGRRWPRLAGRDPPATSGSR